MLQYSLSDPYDSTCEKDYSVTSLECYLGGLDSLSENMHINRSIRTVGKYLSRRMDEESEKFHVKLIRNQPAEIPAAEKTIPRLKENKKEYFSYLQLVGYIIQKCAESKMGYKQFFDALKKPSLEFIPFYDDILTDLSIAVPTASKKDVERRAEIMHTAFDYINLIACALHSDYGDDKRALKVLEHNSKTFAIKAEAISNLHLLESTSCDESSYLDTFYRIVSFARATAWETEMLRAFQDVKAIFSGRKPAESFDKLIRAECRKVVKEDQVSLAYKDGEIVEIMSDQIELMEEIADDSIDDYLDALERYVKVHIVEIAQKVFCEDDPSRSKRRSIESHMVRFRGYWIFEFDRYGKHCFLSKAKLISVLQASYLVLPRAQFAPRKSGTPRERSDKNKVRENASLSTSFIESPDCPYRESYYQQLLCVWADYQTLFNIATPEYAMYYLEVNITALKSFLKSRSCLTLPELQKRAERLLRSATRSLIYIEDDCEEIQSFCRELSEKIDASVFYTDSFKAHASMNRFGAFCRLYGGQSIVEMLMHKLECWDKKEPLIVKIAPSNMLQSEIPALGMQLSWDITSKEVVLEDFFGDIM